jgi:hypothetical protein
MVLNNIPQHRPQRLIVGGLAIVLAITAIMGRIPIGFSESAGIWASGVFGKVSIILAVSWLAWPQLMWLKQSPGGSAALAGCGIIGIVFIARPRLLLYAIPLIVGGVGILLAMTWLQRLFTPPK